MQKKRKITLNQCYLSFVLLPYLKPYNVTLIPVLDIIFKMWKVAATLTIIFAFFYSKEKIQKQSMCLIGFLITWTVSLIINKAPIVDFGNNILSIIGMLLLFETKINNKKFKVDIVQILYAISCVYMVLNLITVVIKRPFLSGGMELGDNANFLGGDNYSAFILIVMCGILFLHDIQCYETIKIKTWFIALVGWVCLAIPFALTGMIAYALLLLVVFLDVNKTMRAAIRKFFSWKTAIVFCLFFVLAISYFHLDILVASLLGGLEKSGFNGRNMIWPMAISAFMKKPILGYGGIDAELASTWFIAGANHTHNFLLEFPFSTGIIGTAFFVTYMGYLLRKTKIKNNKVERMLLMVLAAYIICGTFDFYIGLIWFYLLLDLIWLFKDNSRKIKKEAVVNKKRE